MVEVGIALAVSVLLAMGLALILNRRWPNASERRLGWICGSLPPLVLIGLLIWAFVWATSEPAAPDEIDVSGTVIAAVVVMGPILVLVSLAASVSAAIAIVRHVRERRGR